MSGCILLGIILVDGVRAEAKLTHSDEYRRLYATCLAMAEQSNLPEVRAPLARSGEGLQRPAWRSQCYGASIEIAIGAPGHAGSR